MLYLRIPRDQNGEFAQQTVPAYRQSSESLEQTIIQLYRKGITTREITDLTESSENYKEMLQSLKKRGLEQVLLFISDGLIGLPDAATDVFPKAKHQSCWTHLQRNVIRKVRPADTKDIVSKLRNVYTADSREEAEKKLEDFRATWSSRYPKVTDRFIGKTNLFSFMDFPKRSGVHCTRITWLRASTSELSE